MPPLQINGNLVRLVTFFKFQREQSAVISRILELFNRNWFSVRENALYLKNS